MKSTGRLAIWNDCAQGQEELYERWYHSEHLSDRVTIKGFRAGRRHESLIGSPKFFTYYETESPSVLYSREYIAQLDAPSKLTRQVMAGTFINVIRTVCFCAHQLGDARGGILVVARSASSNLELPLSKIGSVLFGELGVVRTEMWTRAVNQTPTTNTAREEEQLRGLDSVIESALVIHTTRETEADIVFQRLSDSGIESLDIGVYKLLNELHHQDLQ